MMDTTERLVYMANQIAQAFKSMGEQDAILSTADHIKMYWDPRMIAGIQKADLSGLSAIASKAIDIVNGPVAHQSHGTQFASVNEDGSGFNDAG